MLNLATRYYNWAPSVYMSPNSTLWIGVVTIVLAVAIGFLAGLSEGGEIGFGYGCFVLMGGMMALICWPVLLPLAILVVAGVILALVPVALGRLFKS